MEKDSRNYGIDLLRFISMLGILILHILSHGGGIETYSYTLSTSKYSVIWAIEIFAYPAVDCYALISGYVGYSETEKPYKYWKYISMWFQVLLYSFGLTLIAYFCSDVGLKELIKAAMPVTFSQYWYFTAYTGVFFVAPWAKRFVKTCSVESGKRFLFTVMILTIYLTFAGFADPFKLSNGYSFLWLFILYMTGSFIRKTGVGRKANMKILISIGVLFLLITWLAQICLQEKNFLFSYTSITMVGVACIYVILFSKIKISGKAKNIINIFTPCVFGVYLIHDNPALRKLIIENKFTWILEKPTYSIGFWILLSAIIIFIVCILIDKLRELFFIKLGINSFSMKIERRTQHVIEIIAQYFETNNEL